MLKMLKPTYRFFSVIFLQFSVFFGFSNTDVGFGFGLSKNRGFGFGSVNRPSSELEASWFALRRFLPPTHPPTRW